MCKAKNVPCNKQQQQQQRWQYFVSWTQKNRANVRREFLSAVSIDTKKESWSEFFAAKQENVDESTEKIKQQNLQKEA